MVAEGKGPKAEEKRQKGIETVRQLPTDAER